MCFPLAGAADIASGWLITGEANLARHGYMAEKDNIRLDNLLAGLNGRVAGSGPHELAFLMAGGNNRVYRLECVGCAYLIKHYFFDEKDQRDRLEHEFSFMTYVWRQGIRVIPEPIACDHENRLGLYEFITGRSLRSAEIKPQHLQQALDFYEALNRGKNLVEAGDLPKASEACFSMGEHLASVERRLARFQQLEAVDPLTEAARVFFHQDLLPAWQKIRATIVDKLVKEKIALDEEIPVTEHCLSPSDFGFHNSLLVSDGSSLKFGTVGATRMFCEGEAGEVELRFMQALEQTRSWEIRAGALLLFKDSEVLARFTVYSRRHSTEP